MVKQRLGHQTKLKMKGQSLVEFALVLPLLLVLVVSAIELGRLFYTQIVITNAAREGAYYLSTHPSETGGAVSAALAEAENSGIPDVTVTTGSCANTGDCIVVTVDTRVDNLIVLGFIGNTFSITQTHNTFDLTASVEMMAEP